MPERERERERGSSSGEISLEDNNVKVNDGEPPERIQAVGLLPSSWFAMSSTNWTAPRVGTTGEEEVAGGGKEEKAAAVSCSIYVEHFGKGLSLGGGYSKGGGYSGGGGSGYDGGDILGHGGRFGKRQSGEDEDCVAHSGRIRTAATWATSEDSRANATGASRTTTPHAVEPSIAKWRDLFIFADVDSLRIELGSLL
jgi:hypothetical protein